MISIFLLLEMDYFLIIMLNHLLMEFGLILMVIITMDKVSSETQKFFGERSRGFYGKIHFLEGSESIRNGIPRLIEDISRNAIKLFISYASQDMGISLTPFVNEWMDRISVE